MPLQISKLDQVDDKHPHTHTRTHDKQTYKHRHKHPSGSPRAVCDDTYTAQHTHIFSQDASNTCHHSNPSVRGVTACLSCLHHTDNILADSHQ